MQMNSKVVRCISDAAPSEMLMLMWADVSYRQNIGPARKRALLETYRLKLFDLTIMTCFDLFFKIRRNEKKYSLRKP
jgi:hypothetical protein